MFQRSDFQNLPLHAIIGWPATILIFIGIAAIIAVFGVAVLLVVSHLQWVA